MGSITHQFTLRGRSVSGDGSLHHHHKYGTWILVSRRFNSPQMLFLLLLPCELRGKLFNSSSLFTPQIVFILIFFLFNLSYCMVVFICSCGIRMKRKETKADGRENERSKTFPALMNI